MISFFIFGGVYGFIIVPETVEQCADVCADQPFLKCTISHMYSYAQNSSTYFNMQTGFQPHVSHASMPAEAWQHACIAGVAIS